MNERPYPDGIDCVWLASDCEGHLGAFITAGVGPIPTEALKTDYMPVEDIEGLLCEMPKVSGAELLVSVKRPDDFIDLAERGVFVYDWTDIHRATSDAVRAYEPVAIPAKPIKVDALPVDLATVARSLNFLSAKFSDQIPLNIRLHASCRDGE